MILNDISRDFFFLLVVFPQLFPVPLKFFLSISDATKELLSAFWRNRYPFIANVPRPTSYKSVQSCSRARNSKNLNGTGFDATLRTKKIVSDIRISRNEKDFEVVTNEPDEQLDVGDFFRFELLKVFW